MHDRPMKDAMTITSDPGLFRGVRDWLAEIARNEGFDDRQALELMVAVNEACANIHRHAYDGSQEGAIEFQLEVDGETLDLRIRDYGSRFRPESCGTPNLAEPSEGGYGVYLIRELMDEVEYIPQDAGTELRMRKIRRRSEGGGPGGADA